MEETINFDVAPSLIQFEQLLTPDGWKIIRSGPQFFRATKQLGQSEFPLSLATTWYIDVQDTGMGVEITVSVPAFAEGMYARRRILGLIAEISEEVPGECKTQAELEVDVLNHLREYVANSGE